MSARSEQFGKLAELRRPSQIVHERVRVLALARRSDAFSDSIGMFGAEHRRVGAKIIDRRCAAVGSDADVILAAHADGVLDVCHDVGSGGVTGMIKERHEVDPNKPAAVGNAAQFLVSLVTRQVY